MASVLIAGDVHLKPFIFDRLDKVDKNADYICVLGDLPDDFGEGNNLALYKKTFDRAIRFAHEHKNADNPMDYSCIESYSKEEDDV